MIDERDRGGYPDSYYLASANALRRRPPLRGSVRAEVCVIGGGYTGVSAALHLAGRGYQVVLLEAERLGWGASGRNGGQVGIGQRREQRELERMTDPSTATALWELGLEAPRLVRSLIEQHRIRCDLKNGVLHVAAKAAHVAELRANVAYLRERYHYEATEFLDRDAVRERIGSDRYYAGELNTEAAHLHPLNYLLGLADAGEQAGATIYEGSRVSAIADNGATTVFTDQGRVEAQYLVIACNGYLQRLVPSIASQIMPINNFILATEPLTPAQARALIRDDTAVADTLFVINYWKLSGDNRLLFGGGENYRRRFPRDLKRFVRKYLLRVYPQLDNTRIDYAWGGTLAITMNRLPSFGRISPTVFYAHGYSGHGVPTATLAGKLMAEAIAGTAERFDVMARLPTRPFPGGVALRWPGLVLGMLYYSLRDRLG